MNKRPEKRHRSCSKSCRNYDKQRDTEFDNVTLRPQKKM